LAGVSGIAMMQCYEMHAATSQHKQKLWEIMSFVVCITSQDDIYLHI